MLSEKIKFLCESLGASNVAIAKCAELDASSISRLRSAARVPNKKSATIDKLADGFIRYAEKRNLTEMLFSIIFYAGGDVKTELKDWLYEDEAAREKYSAGASAFFSFGNKLSAVMQLCGLSNIWLSRMINIDASYISRFRSGQRTPRSNPELVEQLCQTLFDQIIIKNQTIALAEMMGVSFENTELFYIIFRNWLCDFESNNALAIKRLLTTIDSFSQLSYDDFLALSESAQAICYSNSNLYYDEEGLQDAVLRFLTEVAESSATEILLYSDEKMDWLTQNKEFNTKWRLLMARLIQKGIHIKIIHNVDRDLDEMLEAIQNWIPLYMTGKIEPYYPKLKNGERFSHTLFLCPELACVEGSNFNNIKKGRCLYNYYTDHEHLSFYASEYEAMLKEAKPLVHMHLDGVRSEQERREEGYFKNVEIAINTSSVVVRRTAAPFISFVALHPLLRDAFSDFMNNEC